MKNKIKNVLRGTIKHIKLWNKWRKGNRNSKITNVLVLFKVIESPSMNTLHVPCGTMKER